MSELERVHDFAEVASNFCGWVEGPAFEPAQEVAAATALLAELVFRALYLPTLEPNALDWGQPLQRTDALKNRFVSLPFQYYWVVFHPTNLEMEKEREPVTGDLADDLMDVYADLKGGLNFYELGQLENAAFAWRTTYGFHWGRHATEAMHALYCHSSDSEES